MTTGQTQEKWMRAHACQHQPVDVILLCLPYSEPKTADMSNNETHFFSSSLSDWVFWAACVCTKFFNGNHFTDKRRFVISVVLFFFPPFDFHNEYVGRRRIYTPKITQLELVLSLSNFFVCYCCCCGFSLYSTMFGIRTRCGCYYFVLFTRMRSSYILACLVCWQLNRTN